MGLKTRSQFFYGHEITPDENYISIDEGFGEVSVFLNPSGYTFTELATELAKALNDAGSLNYSVAADRLTRKFTITASAPFSILASSGAYAGSGVYSKIGFNIADKTGLSVYTSDFATGSVWRPQFVLFNYIPTAHRVSSNQATQDESGSGDIQVVSFGTVNYMECEARFITNRADKPTIIEQDTAGVENAMNFLSYIRLKNRIEFMPDREDPTAFEKLILFRTAQSQQGIEVRLDEMTELNLQDYYKTGLLTFRKVVS